MATRLTLCLLLIMAGTVGADSIQVKREKRPGPDVIHARMTVRAPLPVLLSALETPCAVRHWLPRTREVKVIDSRDSDVTKVSLITQFPWPWSDRVALLEFRRHSPSPGQVEIVMRALSDGDTLRGLVRVSQSTARWQLEEQDGSVRVQYRQRFNPSGTVPQWLADKVAESKVRDALDNVRQMVENRAAAGSGCRWLAAAGGGGGGPQSD